MMRHLNRFSHPVMLLSHKWVGKSMGGRVTLVRMIALDVLAVDLKTHLLSQVKPNSHQEQRKGKIEPKTQGQNQNGNLVWWVKTLDPENEEPETQKTSLKRKMDPTHNDVLKLRKRKRIWRTVICHSRLCKWNRILDTSSRIIIKRQMLRSKLI